MEEILRHTEIRIWIGKERKGPLAKEKSASPLPFPNLVPGGFLLVMVAIPEHTSIVKHKYILVQLCQDDTKALHVKWGTVYLSFLGLMFCSVSELPC